jgi:hypothetical protein
VKTVFVVVNEGGYGRVVGVFASEQAAKASFSEPDGYYEIMEYGVETEARVVPCPVCGFPGYETEKCDKCAGSVAK